MNTAPELGTGPSPPDAPTGRRRIPLRSLAGRPHACSKDVRLQVLQGVDLFRDLTADQLTAVNAEMIAHAWDEDAPLYRAGDRADHLYILASGRAKAFRSTADGQDVVVDFLAPGDLFGDLQILGRSQHTETVQALTNVCALQIGTREFREILTQQPRVALRVLHAVSIQLALARSSVTKQSTATVAERVAAVLLWLAEKFGESGTTGTLIEIPLSRADLASITGSTTASVSRVMSGLRKDGVIDSGRRWTEILDHRRLSALASQEVAPATRPGAAPTPD